MEAHIPIKRVLEDQLDRLQSIVTESGDSSQNRLALEVCRHFGLRDARGRERVSSCVVALKQLASQGRIEGLPEPSGQRRRATPRRLGEAVEKPRDVPASVAAIQGLRILLVRTDAERALWNELMAREHFLGAPILAGHQLRYLVDSAHGCLGGFGFAAAALKVADRDAWIGWDADRRRAERHRVLSMSRFLIRVPVANLASKTLSMCLSRLGADVAQRYGFLPWLVETYVDPTRDGASLRAANWQLVGFTRGRGRQDRAREMAESVKAVYMYVLDRDWRHKLGVAEPMPALSPGEGLDASAWAHHEFGGAPIGDRRLSARLVEIARRQGESPMSSYSGLARPDPAGVRAYYRFLDQPETSAVTPANILAPHRQRTVQRMCGQRVALCIQDGTDLNFATRPGCDGLGIIGTNQTASQTLGLHLHASYVVSGEGLPLGVARLAFDAPPRPRAKTGSGEDVEMSRRTSQRWLDGLDDIADLAARTTGVKVVCVMDREADFFELFDRCRQHRRLSMLVRARHDRVLKRGAAKLFTRLRTSACRGTMQIDIPRLTARPKSSGRKKQPGRTARRNAVLELRWLSTTLPATAGCPDAAPVAVTALHLLETAPPAGEAPVEWFLLTDLPVDHAEAAQEIVGWYALRWRIECWFRVLKSGCRVEHLATRKACRLERQITIHAVIAWRLALMTLLGRDVPTMKPDCLFSDLELRFLGDYARRYRLDPPDTLGAAVKLVAILGGYLDRKHDPAPGNQTMWHGYPRLATAALAYECLLEALDLDPTSEGHDRALHDL